MKALIAEDDELSAALLGHILEKYGDIDIAVNGEEALICARKAMDEGSPYDLFCLDIMMPKVDGQTVLRELRAEERNRQVTEVDAAKVIMISALDDSRNILNAFQEGCEAYLIKPLDRATLLDQLKEFGLIETG
jgi:two-component system chemotaxis response regulator CheY